MADHELEVAAVATVLRAAVRVRDSGMEMDGRIDERLQPALSSLVERAYQYEESTAVEAELDRVPPRVALLPSDGHDLDPHATAVNAVLAASATLVETLDALDDAAALPAYAAGLLDDVGAAVAEHAALGDLAAGWRADGGRLALVVTAPPVTAVGPGGATPPRTFPGTPDNVRVVADDGEQTLGCGARGPGVARGLQVAP